MAGDGFSIPDLGSEGSVRLMKNGLAMTSHKFGLDIMALDKGRDFFSQVVAKVHVGFGKDFRLLIGQMTNPCFPAFLDRNSLRHLDFESNAAFIWAERAIHQINSI